MNDTAPAWAKGFDLQQLKQVSAFFKSAHKRWAFGAYSTPNDAAIADYLARGNCLLAQAGGRLAAAAMWRRLGMVREVHDFTGAAHFMPQGTVVVGSFAAASVATGVEVLAPLLQEPNVWCEIFQEDEISREVMAQAGFALAFVHIAACSDIIGFYTRGARAAAPLPAFERRALHIIQEHFISEPERREILSEVEGAAEFWAQHYSTYNKRKSWEAFALRGYEPNDPRSIIKPAEMAKKWKQEHPGWEKWRCDATVIANRFPTANAVADRLPFTKDRVRLMKLRPGGELTRHADITDRQAGLRDGLVARLHIPLVTNGDVVMTGWESDGSRVSMRWPERALCYLDQRKPHCVVNRAPDKPRIHFVIDCHSTQRLRDWLA